MMRSLGEELGVQVDVFGPEASMTGICQARRRRRQRWQAAGARRAWVGRTSTQMQRRARLRPPPAALLPPCPLVQQLAIDHIKQFDTNGASA